MDRPKEPKAQKQGWRPLALADPQPGTVEVDGVVIEDLTGTADAPAPVTPTKGSKAKSKPRPTAKRTSDRGNRRGKRKAEKPSAAKKEKPKPPVKPSPKMTIAELADAYLAHLAAIGKKESTVRSYRGDLNVAIREIGGDTKVSTLTEKRVQAYFESDAVCKNRQGGSRSPITTGKVTRVFRMALLWLEEVGAIEKSPIPRMATPKKRPSNSMLDGAIADAKAKGSRTKSKK